MSNNPSYKKQPTFPAYENISRKNPARLWDVSGNEQGERGSELPATANHYPTLSCEHIPNHYKLDLPEISSEEVLSQAGEFYQSLATDKIVTEKQAKARFLQVSRLIRETGTYSHTLEELQYGATKAWQTSSECIGRSMYRLLNVLDSRSDIATLDDLFTTAEEHMHMVTERDSESGKIRKINPILSFISDVPEKGIQGGVTQGRVVSPFLRSYAGYLETDHGNETLVGDGGHVQHTAFFREKFGWTPPSGKTSPYDFLPLLVEKNGQYRIYDVEPNSALEVRLQLPDGSCSVELKKAFELLDLRWYGIPAVSNLLIRFGGKRYIVILNGWYLMEEILFDLLDSGRYNFSAKLKAEVSDLLECEDLFKNESQEERIKSLVRLSIRSSFKAAGIPVSESTPTTRIFVRSHQKLVSENKPQGGIHERFAEYLLPEDKEKIRELSFEGHPFPSICFLNLRTQEKILKMGYCPFSGQKVDDGHDELHPIGCPVSRVKKLVKRL